MKRLFFILLTLTLHLPRPGALAAEKNSVEKKTNGDFVAIPLPFYETFTGYGLILKLLHTDIIDSLYFDSVNVATTEKHFVSLNTIGQKKLPFLPNIFWDVVLGGTHLKIKYYGQGNHNQLRDPAVYSHKSYIITPRVGYSFPFPLKVYLKTSHKRKRLRDFKDPAGWHTSLWESLKHKDVRENRVGFGFSYKVVDSEVRPTEGVDLSYDYLIASPRLMLNDYSFREVIASFAFYLPVVKKMSHGTKISYQRVSESAPFYEHPTIRVRGIEKSRHKSNSTFVVQNEERIYVAKDWVMVPFWDIGRVMKEYSGTIYHDFHYGYGLGVRYIAKDVLVIRADIGFSKGGERAFSFNYGHTF